MNKASVNPAPAPFKALINRGEAIVTVGIVLLFGAFPLLKSNLVIASGMVILAFSGFAWILRWHIALPLGAFCFSCMALSLIELPSQLLFAVGLIVYALVLKFGPNRGKSRWLKGGSLTREVGALMAVSVLSSAIALNVWFFTVRPDIHDLIEQYLPDWPLLFLVLGGLAFSILNAAVEELAYRGVLMDALDKSIGVGMLSLSGQATAFGLLHINGFPRGWTGVILAFIFGMLMGWVRRRSGGFLAPWIAHIATDIVIVFMVAGYARSFE